MMRTMDQKIWRHKDTWTSKTHMLKLSVAKNHVRKLIAVTGLTKTVDIGGTFPRPAIAFSGARGRPALAFG